MFDIDCLQPSDLNLRIAVVCETWPPEINGVAITMHRLALQLQHRGHSVQVIRPRQPSMETAPLGHGEFDETLTRGLPIPAYPHLRMGLPAKRLLTRLWQCQRPDVVHVATEGPLGWSAVQAAKKLRIPVSSDFRTNFHSYGQHYGMGKFTKVIAAYLRKFHNLTDFTTVPTETLRGDLHSQGFKRLQVIARGIDTERFHPSHRSQALRQLWGAAAHDRVYVYVGRLAPEKNPMLLSQAWQVISERDRNAKLVILGHGPAADTYRNLMPQAIYVGAQSGQDLPVHYASADVLLFPSVTETYGNVVPEAMASGLMGLTFDYAASSALVLHNHNGWVAPFADHKHYLALAAELSLLPEHRVAAMRQAAVQTMQSHGWDAISAKIEQLWREQLPKPLPHGASALSVGTALPQA